MSDKLFKNDLTPSACQNDGNFGQAAAASFCCLSHPSSPCPSHSLVSSPGENRPQRRIFLNDYPMGSCACTALLILEKPGGRKRVCQPGWDALLGRDQLPFLRVAGDILTPLCGASVASDSQ